jgi:cytochrome P450 family 110
MNALPPGPDKIGLLEIIRSIVASPIPYLKRYTAMYGDTFRMPTSNGPLTITGSPEAIRAIYTADPDLFEVWGAQLTEPVFGKTSLVVATGERHRRDRKLLSPPFNGNSMRAFGPAIARAAEAAIARHPFGRPFSMLETTQAIALDIIVRVVFCVQGEARVEKTRRAVLKLIDSLSLVMLIVLFPALRREFGGIGPFARQKRAGMELEAVLSDEIRERLRGASASPEDILSLLMSVRYDDGAPMSEAALIDQLRALLFAGHETTAVSLAWALYFLHREPDALSRVLAEIDALGPDPDPHALTSLPYLEAVCMETLRIRPPVVGVGRVTKKPFDLVRYTIPAGEAISPSPLLLHAREDLYPEPERFLPARFLERKFSPFEYIPFGGGARRCVGAAFAMYEMKVVLGTLLRSYRLRLMSSAPIAHVQRGITMGPEGGIPMILLGKREARAATRTAA